MIKKRYFTIYFLFILSLLCFFNGLTLKNARIEETLPKVFANDVSVTQGSYAYVYIKGGDFDSVGSFELFVYYDDSIFIVNSQSAIALISNEMVSTNVATSGELELFRASATGVSGSGDIWKIVFKVKDSTSTCCYPITIAVGEANKIDFSPLSIDAQNFYITVTEKSTVVKTTSFVASTPTDIKQGESTSIAYYVSGHTNNFASAEFEINYDDTLLQLDGVLLGTELTNLNGALVSVNDTISGYVKITFTALSGVANYIYSNNPIFTLTFIAIKNQSVSAEVVMDASALYDIDLNAIEGNSVTKKINVIYDEPEVVLPKIYLEGYNGYDSEFSLNVIAEKDIKLAAGDFKLNYDTTILSCVSVLKTI